MITCLHRDLTVGVGSYAGRCPVQSLARCPGCIRRVDCLLVSELRLNILPVEIQIASEPEMVCRLDRSAAAESNVRRLPGANVALHIYDWGRYTYVWPRLGRAVPEVIEGSRLERISVHALPADVAAFAAREGAADSLVIANWERLPGSLGRPVRLVYPRNLAQEALGSELGDDIGMFPVLTVDRICSGGFGPGPVGLVLDIGLLNRLNIPLADLGDAGIELRDMRVVWRHHEECRCGPEPPMGRAGRLLGGDPRGSVAVARAGVSVEAPARCLRPEVSRSSLEHYLSHLRLASHREIQQRLDRVANSYQRPEMQWRCLERLRDILNSFTVFCSTTATLASPVVATASEAVSSPTAPSLLSPLPAPTLNFQYGAPQTGQGAAAGLRRHGPYDLKIVSRRDSIRAVVLCPRAFQDGAQRLVSALRQGITGFPGMERLYRLHSVTPEIRLLKDSTARAYREAAAEIGREQPDIVFLVVGYADRYAAVGENPYLAAKALLANLNIASQAVTIETLRQTEASLRWAVDSIALQAYAKIGNVPYVLHDPAGVRELVIGIGRSDVYDPQGRFHKQLFGAAAAFRQDGDFLFAGSTALVSDRETYEEVLAKLLADFMDRFEHQQGAPPDRLILHVFKRTGRKELGAVKRALDGRSTRFALVHVNRDTPLWMVKVIQGQFAAPEPGAVVALGEQDRLLVAGDANQTRNLHPLRVTLDRASTFQDMDRITAQIHGFTASSLRGFHRAHEPCTILYGRLLAAQVAQLSRYHFQPDLATAIGDRPWFL